MSVITEVEIKMNDVRLVAELGNLVEAAGVESRNNVPRTVRTLSPIRVAQWV
jgi:hypothetical protein